MKKLHTLNSWLIVLCTAFTSILFTGCNSSRLAQTNHLQHPTQAGQTSNTFAASQIAAENSLNTSDTYQLTASTSEDVALLPAAAGTNSLSLPAEQTKTQPEVATQEKQVKTNKLKALPAKILLKAALKKVEKAEKKRDIKNQKAAEAGKALDPDIRTGILIGALGLILIIIGAAVASSLLYTLGGIGLTVGLIVIILAALEVI